MRPLFTIAIAMHDYGELTKKCLASLEQSKGLDRAEIIVVDDGGTEPLDLPETVGPAKVGVLRVEWGGVGPALNKALEYAHAPYFVTLNNDVEILCPDWLELIRQKFLEDPKMALVGIETADTCGSIDENGHGYPGKEFEYVEGAVMMARTSVARRIKGGLFDPEYRFAYFEDNDLSLRVRRMGYHIGRVPVSVRHKRCGTMGTVIQQGVDVDGFHRINEETYKKRWNRYIRNRNFEEIWSIKRSGANGDVLFLTPILREIKKQNAEAHIVVNTNCPEVLEGNPDVVAVDRPFNYEIYPAFHRIDLDGAYESRPDMHIIEAYQEVSGVSTDDWRLRLNPGEEARKWAKERIVERPYAVLHPHIGQPWLGRNPPEILFNQVSHYLAKRGWLVVLVGTQMGGDYVNHHIDLRGKTTLRQVAALIERSSLFFGVDSALMNFAQASLVATVGVFGCMNHKNILLPFPFVKALTARPMEVGCLGCHTVYAERPKGSPGRCIREKAHGDVCMSKIKVEDAVSAIEHVLAMKNPYSETAKIRERVLPFCQGRGIDIGCGRDPLTGEILSFDRDSWPEVKMQGDARKLQISDGTFDFLFSSHCIEDLDDTEAVIKEWSRVVKRGGNVVVATPNEHFTGFNKDHVWSHFTPEEMSEYFNAAGLEILVAENWGDYQTIVIGRKP